jgi:ubiquinone/menaquinone biosynthesis C-methylase UbiE
MGQTQRLTIEEQVAGHYAQRDLERTILDALVDTAGALARRAGLAGRVSYRHASALALPFERDTFDGAYMLHVGMNIEDKPALFAELHRILKREGLFAIFDVMRGGDGTLSFPLRWAATPETSFVVSAAKYREALQAAGFAIIKERDRADFARAFFREVAERTAKAGGPPPLGIHILMKTDVPQKLANYVSSLDAGVIAPIEMICRAR